MASVDKLTLVELIEEHKARLSPEALEMWEELDTSLYMSPEEDTTLKPREAELMRNMGYLPQSDQHTIHILTELRAGLYQSEYSDSRGDPSQPHRDKCVITASHIKDRDERGPGGQVDIDAVLHCTVDQALARLREGGQVSGRRIDDLDDHTVQGIWEAHRAGEIAVEDALDDVIVRAAGVLAERGYWMWMFMAASEEGSSWRDLHGAYWVVGHEDGRIREWGT